jgi:hypothetical protein
MFGGGGEVLQCQEFYIHLRYGAIQLLWRENTNEIEVSEKQYLTAMNGFIIVSGLNTL